MDLLDVCSCRAHQALEDGGMLGVDRQNAGAVLCCKVHHYLSGSHQCLLVGQGYGLSCLDGIYRRCKSAEPYHRGEHDVDVV